MTEQQTDPMDDYGRRLGAELRALGDRAVRPYDPYAIAHSVAVGRASPGRWSAIGAALRGVRPMALAILVLASALLLALWVGSREQPPPAVPFTLGSIAFARDGDLYVAEPDGSQPNRLPDGQLDSTEVSKFAFSPDRRYLAFAQISNPLTGAETLRIVSPGGTTVGTYTGGSSASG